MPAEQKDWRKQIRDKIVDRQNLPKVLGPLKECGISVVFTNGCFDLFHRNHAIYLAEAANHGDLLVVALNSDDSVRRQGKGPERPIQTFDARATVVASLAFVGLVVKMDEDTPKELIEEVLPDVLVKGWDYDPDETDPTLKKYIVGRETVLARGGRVLVAEPSIPGITTTDIVKKLRK